MLTVSILCFIVSAGDTLNTEHWMPWGHMAFLKAGQGQGLQLFWEVKDFTGILAVDTE